MVDKYKINDYLATINNRGDIDLLALLDFYWKEYLNAQKAGEDRDTWEAIKYRCIEAAYHFEQGDLRETSISFFFLGTADEEARHPTPADQARMGRYAVEGLKRLRPLEQRNLRKSHAKGLVALLANAAWKSDTDDVIRLGDMCERIWALIHSLNVSTEILDELPNNAQGLRTWLRPNAPEYAKKGGRPRK